VIRALKSVTWFGAPRVSKGRKKKKRILKKGEKVAHQETETAGALYLDKVVSNLTPMRTRKEGRGGKKRGAFTKTKRGVDATAVSQKIRWPLCRKSRRGRITGEGLDSGQREDG